MNDNGFDWGREPEREEETTYTDPQPEGFDPFPTETQDAGFDPFNMDTQSGATPPPFPTETQEAGFDPFNMGTQSGATPPPFQTETQDAGFDPFNMGTQSGATPPPFPTETRDAGFDPFNMGTQSSTNPPPFTPEPGATASPFDSPYFQGGNPSPSYNQKPSGGKGKTIAFGVIVACLVIALAFMVKSLFFPTSVNPTTDGSDTYDTTAQAPQVTVASTQSATITNIDSVNSVWVADKVRPSIVGVMTYIDGQLAGEGSGVLWGTDSTGTYTYVVTCAHVIDESGATFGILLLDGRRYEAEMVATDARTDIGVLKVEATGLPLAELGDSSALKIGEPIYAIGNPGGSEYFGSITDGIVSAIDRSISATYTMTCIQHNAAINPGNSGGALVNTSGQVVGINSSKIASTDYEGMGFAVPMSIVKPVVDALIQYKYVPNRPKLGIEYADVSSYQLYSMVVSIKGLPQGSLVIAGISSDSSLANTEAQVGDLIIGVNGKDMDDSSVLLDLIDTGAVGDTLTLTLCRIEKRTYKTTTFDVTITLVEDKGSSVEEETTTQATTQGNYYYGGSDNFEDFFSDYFGFGF